MSTYNTLVPQSDSTEETNSLIDIFAKEFPTLLPAQGKHIDLVSIPENDMDIYTIVHKPTFVPMLPRLFSTALPLDTTIPGNRLDPTLFTSGCFPLRLFMLWALYYKGGFNHWLSTLSTGTNVDGFNMLLFNVVNGSTIVKPNVYAATNGTGNTPYVKQCTRDRTGVQFHEPYRSLQPYSTMNNLGSYAFAPYYRENTVGAYFTTNDNSTPAQTFAEWGFAADDDTRYYWMMGPPALLLS